MVQDTPFDRPTTDDSNTATGWHGASSMKSSFDMYALAHAELSELLEIRDTSNRVTFPPKLEGNKVVNTEDTLNWYVDTVLGQVLIAAKSEPWQSNDRFKKEDTSRVTAKRVTNVPKQFFDDYIGPCGSAVQGRLNAVDETYRLQYNHLYYLMAPEICFVEATPSASNGVYLVPVEDYVALFGIEKAEFHAGKPVSQYLDTDTDESDPAVELDLDEP